MQNCLSSSGNRLEQDEKCDPRFTRGVSLEADEAASDDITDHYGS